MSYLDIWQIQHPGHPFHQVDPTTRAVEQNKPGIGHHHTQRNPGKTDTGADVENDTRCVSKPAGEEQRVTDMPIVDPDRFVGPNPARLNRFGEQPLPISIESRDLVGGQLATGPLAAAGPEQMGRFHVKQITPDRTVEGNSSF